MSDFPAPAIYAAERRVIAAYRGWYGNEPVSPSTIRDMAMRLLREEANEMKSKEKR